MKHLVQASCAGQEDVAMNPGPFILMVINGNQDNKLLSEGIKTGRDFEGLLKTEIELAAADLEFLPGRQEGQLRVHAKPTSITQALESGPAPSPLKPGHGLYSCCGMVKKAMVPKRTAVDARVAELMRTGAAARIPAQQRGRRQRQLNLKPPLLCLMRRR